MENIIFCGGCGSFISNDEISAGKASQINNIYYCLKCSTGQKITPVKPNISPITSVGNKPPIRPAPTTPPNRGPVSTPVNPLRSNLSQQTARPVSPKAVPPTPQRPTTTSNRPTVVYQPKPMDTKSTIPVPKPTDHITRRIPMQQIPEVRPITRKIEPHKSVTRFSMKPPSPDTNSMNTEEDAEMRPPTRDFTREQPAKTNMKKIYIIGGAVVGVIIIVLIITSMISSKATDDAKIKKDALAKSYYTEIVETERDFPDDPKKVLAKIEERWESIKNTPYEKRVKEIEATANERLDHLKKFKKLSASVPTTKDEIDERKQEYIQLKSEASDYPELVEKINDAIKALNLEKQKISDEEKSVEAQIKKDFDDFKSKADKYKEQKSYKDILKLCEEFLGKPANSKFQQEVEKIKADAQQAIKEIEIKERERWDWQILNDDSSKWTRQGATNAEFSVDENTQLVLKNPSGNPQGTLVVMNNNNGENWKDFTMEIEFKIVSGALDMGLRGTQIPFPRKFSVEWYKYTINVKGDELTMTGTELPEPKKVKIPTNAAPIVIAAKPGDEIIIKSLKAKSIK